MKIVFVSGRGGARSCRGLMLTLRFLKTNGVQNMICQVNGHAIELPADMKAVTGASGPGAYDAIHYRGTEICTFETDQPEGAPYAGPFAVMTEDGDIIDAADLAAARAIIDAILAA